MSLLIIVPIIWHVGTNVNLVASLALAHYSRRSMSRKACLLSCWKSRLFKRHNVTDCNPMPANGYKKDSSLRSLLHLFTHSEMWSETR